MLRKVLRWFLLTVTVLSCETMLAQLQTDTLGIRFRLDSIRIDMDFAGNRQAWDTFEQNFRDHFQNVSPRFLRLDIYSGASPEGTAAHNRWLGENRGIAIRRLVRQRLGSRVGSIIVHNEAARWDGLYESVAASNEPWRDEVLRIIEQPASVEENRIDHREPKLRALHGGAVWSILLSRYLAPLRSGATAILSYVGGRDTIVVRDTVVMECAGSPVIPAVVGVGTDQASRNRKLGNPYCVSRSGSCAPTCHCSPQVRPTCRLSGRSTTRTGGASMWRVSGRGGPSPIMPTQTKYYMVHSRFAVGLDSAISIIR